MTQWAALAQVELKNIYQKKSLFQLDLQAGMLTQLSGYLVLPVQEKQCENKEARRGTNVFGSSTGLNCLMCHETAPLGVLIYSWKWIKFSTFCKKMSFNYLHLV